MASKTTIRGTRNEAYIINESNFTLIVAKTATINAGQSTSAIFSEIGTENVHIVVDGTISSTKESFSRGISFSSTGHVEIGRGGEITGSFGVSVQSNKFRFDNEGTIRALSETGYGLGVTGAIGGRSFDANIHNSGTITGSIGAQIFADGVFVNEARGKIIGNTTALFAGDGDITYVNHGLIKGGTSAAIIVNGIEGAHIRNTGNIVGNILGNDGADVFDMRGGKISGSITGGAGLDTLITDKANIRLSEFTDGGAFDVVRSSVSYTLSENVEYLYLLGKKSINGTGNGINNGDNIFHGNSGNNVLKGVGDGNNEFYGGKGNDIYIGVDGEYDLYALVSGHGRETAKTYIDGEDLIDLTGFNGFDDDTPFENLQSHFKQKGTDTWIDMGKGDVLILKGVDKDVLDDNDFLFDF